MTFKVAISTMDGNILKDINNIPLSSLIINQYDITPTKSNLKDFFNFKERGLSKSRNHAIDLCESDICLISDDDIKYMSDIEKTIIHAFKEYPSADIITFQIQTPEGNPFKEYSEKSFWHTKRTIMHVASVEIAFRHHPIVDTQLKFDERFGLGSKYPTGEEIIFLADALNRGLKILYLPIAIVIHPKESSGSNYNNPKLIEAKGAMFHRIFEWKGYFISALYAYKKYQKSPYNLSHFYKLMYLGIQDYKKELK